MNFIHQELTSRGVRISVKRGDGELAHAYLYLMNNDLHDEPFGLMEDVFVDESLRGEGIGTMLIVELLAAAKAYGCYKLIATSRDSRPKVHKLYRKLGFSDHGREFRINF